MDDRMKQHGHIGWCDLMSDDVDKARDFYTGVLGWNTEIVDVGQGPYTVFKAGDQPVAGLMGQAAGRAGGRRADRLDVLRDG